ncbi:Hint domain-containing protein [Acidisoma cellulosilytica]|uniref:Hint domain-containing protein n=1 Tax=Acidisoma cellulosilyticum TaxID=2802395 RepID=A0A963YYQ5_9PROT|nr:Hint domain-containing protein [Acidisoma cellulosilyticum]MCB8878787.1 Hint domain-containing protein [Acidisoma cellulosilyticum]
MTTTSITYGEVSSGLTVPAGDFLVILSGGTTVSATVDAGGTELISSGGSSVDALLSGGWEMVSSGGVAIGTTAVGSGIVKVSAGGLAVDTVINSGQLLVSIGGVAFGATIGPNGDMYVQAGFSYDAYISGAYIIVDTNSDLVVPGYASGTVVTADGGDYVANGSTDVDATVNDGSVQWILSTAVASNSLIDSGGTLLLGSGLGVAGGGRSISATINDSGSEIVSSGGSSNDTIVNVGGYEVVSSGGVVSGTNLAGGTLVVASGGTAGSTIISAGGTEVVSSGGILTGTTNVMSGGTLDLYGSLLTDGTGTIDLNAPTGGATVVVSGSPSNLIQGIATGDEIVFSNIAFTDSEVIGSGGTTIDDVTVNYNGSILEVTSNGVTDEIDVSNVNTFGFDLTSENGELAFEVCFAEGTLIATPDGEVAIESLIAGDMVRTLAGAKPVKWIGYRTVDLTKLRNPETQRLVRISKGAFAENVPHTDLLITPEHSIFVDGVLIPVRLLLNGGTVARDETIDRYTYFHVELERHGILIANGLTAESYLDTGNRGRFANGGVMQLDLNFTENANHASWADAAAPLVVDTAIVRPIWDRLAERAKALGLTLPKVAFNLEPDLHLAINGQIIRPAQALDYGVAHRYVFNLPLSLRDGAATIDARILSKSSTPADVQPWLDDRRQLGVMVESILLFDHADGGLRVIDMQDDNLRDGWWTIEMIKGQPARWTNGSAAIPVTAGTRSVEVILAAVSRYVEKPAALRRAA